mgnify:CR=1 FL=1
MRVAIGGYVHETNTFHPLPTTLAIFQGPTGIWVEGDDLLTEISAKFRPARVADEVVLSVADDGDVHAHGLVDGGGVDIDVDLLGARRESVRAAGDAVVEARADIDHHVAFGHCHIGLE